MKKIYILLAGLIVLSTSCGIYRFEDHQTVVSQPVTSGIITPTSADLNVNPTRITHTETFTHDKNNEFDVKYAKDYTLTNAMVKYNADVIVGSLYDITTSSDGKTVSVTVTGYPASYVNFRPTTPTDSLLIATVAPIADEATLRTSSELTQSWNRWENNISFHYGWANKWIGAEYAGGYRFNSTVLAGFGLGYTYCLDAREHYLPIFGQMKFYVFGRKRVNLVLGASVGAGFNIHPQETDYAILTIGAHVRGEVGVNFRLGHTAGLNLAYTFGTSPMRDYYQPLEPKEIYYKAPAMHFFYQGVKLGFTF